MTNLSPAAQAVLDAAFTPERKAKIKEQ